MRPSFVHPSPIVALAQVSIGGNDTALSSGILLAALCRDGTLHIQNSGDSAHPVLMERRGEAGVTMEVLSDGSLIVCWESRLEVLAVNGQSLVSIATADHLNARGMLVCDHRREGKGMTIVVRTDDSHVVLHEQCGDSFVTRSYASLHSDPIIAMAINSEYGNLLTISRGGFVGVWKGMECCYLLDPPRSCRITACVVAPRGHIYLGTKHGDVLVAMQQQGEHRGNLHVMGELRPSHVRGPVRALYLVGTRLVSLGTSDVRVFDVLSFSCMASLAVEDESFRRRCMDGFECATIYVTAAKRMLLMAAIAKGSGTYTWDVTGLLGAPSLQELCVLQLRDANIPVPCALNQYRKSERLYRSSNSTAP